MEADAPSESTSDMRERRSGRYVNEVAPTVVPTKPQGRVPAIARLVLDHLGSYEMWPCTALRWTEEAVMVTIQFTPGEAASARPLWLAVDDVARVLRTGSSTEATLP